MLEDLIYAGNDVQSIIKEKYPNALFKDASDEIHEHRFELSIPDATEDDFYPFAIQQGFARCCLIFEIMLAGNKKGDCAKIDKWIDILKSE